jgi:Tfp pilus assembly protein PilN
MRPVNLIPPEERRGERAPLRTGPLVYIVVGALLLAFVGVYMLVSTGNTISEREAQVAGLEQELESSTARAQALQNFTNFATLEQSRTDTVAALAQSRFDWERVLRELALVIPAGVSLSELTGSISAADGGGSAGSGSGGSVSAQEINSPTLTMTGCARGHESVATFVAALRDIDGVTRVGLASSAESGAEAASGATAPPTGAASGGDCAGDGTSFTLTVAFDEVQVDPLSGGLVPPEAPAPAEGDGSGVPEAEAGRQAAQDSVGSAQEDTDQAVDNFVPGA